MEKAPSTGKTVAAASGANSAGIIVLMYVAKHLGLDDMSFDVAAGIITLASGLAGLVMHNNQRKQENEKASGPAVVGPAP